MGVKYRKGLCKYKTSKGNVYPDWTTAKKTAHALNKKFNPAGKGIQAYYCEFCSKYHVGRYRDKLRKFRYYIHPKQYSVIQYLDNWLNKILVE